MDLDNNTSKSVTPNAIANGIMTSEKDTCSTLCEKRERMGNIANKKG